jgi:hypothetical protein
MATLTFCGATGTVTGSRFLRDHTGQILGAAFVEVHLPNYLQKVEI